MGSLPSLNLPAFCICLISLLLILLSSSLADENKKSPTFPLPQHIVPLSEPLSPREYEQVVAAIKSESRKPSIAQELEHSPGLGPLNNIDIVRVRLDILEAEVVKFSLSGACGNGGCPMWVFLRDPHGYRNVIRDGGWGFNILPSSGSVPDIVFYWQMGAGETDVTQFHYVHDDFVAVPAKPNACGGEDDTRGACPGRMNAAWATVGTDNPHNWASSITLHEYDSLWRTLQADSNNPSISPSRTSFDDNAHAFTIPIVNDIVVKVLGVGTCTPDSNCSISIYGCKQTYPKVSSPNNDWTTGNVPKCDYWPLLRNVTGWGVANATDLTTDPFSPRTAFVIASRLSSTEMELTRYSVTTEPMGPEPGSKLRPDACEIVTPKSGNWLTQWDPAALSAQPVPCD